MKGQKIYTAGAFYDGRPGHEKQTAGILERLKEKVDLQVVSIQVDRPSVFRQGLDLLRYLTSLLPAVEQRLMACDFLIGTGTQTHLPMLAQKRQLGIPAITCMTPAPYLQKHFDLIFAPQHDEAGEGDNIFTTIGPPNSNCNQRKHVAGRVLVLIGGIDPSSHRWDTEDVIGAIEKLAGKEPKKEYIISSSPRTPPDTVTRLKKLAEGSQGIRFFDFHDTPSGWVEKEYGLCQEVWVTGDSISMVYEALSSGCQVGIIPVHWLKKDSKFSKSEEYLWHSGFTRTLEDFLSGKEIPGGVTELNEAGRCADEIIRRYL